MQAAARCPYFRRLYLVTDRAIWHHLQVQHTLILGWSDKLLPIIDQLCNANSSAGGRPIVVMAEREKEDMEEDISKHQIQLRGSRVICRSVGGQSAVAAHMNVGCPAVTT